MNDDQRGVNLDDALEVMIELIGERNFDLCDGVDGHIFSSSRVRFSLANVEDMSFVETLVATFLGALPAAAVAVGVLLRERADRYQSRVDDALAAVIRAIPDHLAELDNYALDLEAATSAAVSPDDYPDPPDMTTLGVLLESARLVASRPKDRMTMGAIADAFYSVQWVQLPAQRARLSNLPALIRMWRSGRLAAAPWAAFVRFANDAQAGRGFTPPAGWDAGGVEHRPTNRVVSRKPS